MAKMTIEHELRIPLREIYSWIRGGYPVPDQREIKRFELELSSGTGDGGHSAGHSVEGELVIGWNEIKNIAETREGPPSDE